MTEDKEYLQAIRSLQKCRQDFRDADMACTNILADQRLTDVIVVGFDPETRAFEL
jgi:hypothetical protein